MYFDLSVPVIAHEVPGVLSSKKSKGKQPQSQNTVVFTPAQIAAIEARLDLLVHLGYTVIAFNQTIEKKIDPKTHVNILLSLVPQVKKRAGVVILKRLTINIDEDSEKGFGLTSANTSLVDTYDLIALAPTTPATFSMACLTHSLPSPLTAHIISLPLTLPRLPFHLKHPSVFEINYAGALGDTESGQMNLRVSDSGLTTKRNWWAAAREVVRVTKGKGIIVSGGVTREAEYRGPKDVRNLITLLGLAQNLAHDASASTPKSLILRAQTRKTYRAILSEPRLVVPTDGAQSPPTTSPSLAGPAVSTETSQQHDQDNKKRPHAENGSGDGPSSRKKKKNKGVTFSK
ncbi:PHP domain-like protein [Paxillus ammoniavirescens]|nr:PHP domain-like protein [Paxillus ammoniavirescens]